MIERTLAYLLSMSVGGLGALALFLLLRPLRRRRLAAAGRSSPPLREAFLALFWMFCGGMAMITVTPRWTVWAFVDLVHGRRWNGAGYPFFEPGNVNLIPFDTFAADGYSLYILAGNLLMFFPFGLLATLLYRTFSWRRALLTGFLITLFIECCQLFVGRTFELDDLMLNTFGVLCGFWTALIFRRIFPRFAGRLLLHSL